MSGGGTFPGSSGASGSSATEMPPMVRTPVPSATSQDTVSDPLPFERPAVLGPVLGPARRARARHGGARPHRPAR